MNNVFENLELTYSLFKNFIIDKNYSQSKHDISWPNYSPGISKQVYAKQYEDLISQRQFTFLLDDKSVIQVYYSYDTDGLKKIRLAYYPVPQVVAVEQDELDNYYGEAMNEALEANYMLLHDLLGQGVSVSNTTHLRFDYDRVVTSHSQNHLQVGSIQEIRIPFGYIMTPFHFLDFIIRNTHVEKHDKMISSQPMLYLLAASNKLKAASDLGKNYTSIYLNL